MTALTDSDYRSYGAATQITHIWEALDQENRPRDSGVINELAENVSFPVGEVASSNFPDGPYDVAALAWTLGELFLVTLSVDKDV